MIPSPARRPSGPERPAPGLLAPGRLALPLVLLALAGGTGPAFAGLGFGEPRPLNTNSFTDSRNDFSCEIATDGQGVWLAVWHGAEPLGDTGGDTDLLYARSTDNGDTWSAPAKFNTNALVDSGTDVVAAATVASNGTWIVTWQSNDTLGETIGSDYDVLFQRSTDAGATWSDVKALDPNAGVDSGADFSPRTASDGRGNWIVVWFTSEDLDGDEFDDYEVAFSRSTDDGLTWVASTLLDSNAPIRRTTGLVIPVVEAIEEGAFVAVWAADWDPPGPYGADSDIYVGRTTDAGASWSAAAPLNHYAVEDSASDSNAGVNLLRRDVSMDVSPAGTLLAVWRSRYDLGGALGGEGDILSSHSVDRGASWSDAIPVNSNSASDPNGNSGSDENPVVTCGGNGIWVAAWETLAFSSPTYGDYDIALTRSTDDGISWSEITPVCVNQATDFGNLDSSPWIVSGASGRWIVNWTTRQPFFGSNGEYDIVISVSDDILAPPDASLEDQESARFLLELLLGRRVLDANGDGVLDTADALELLGVQE